jgi:MoaA/NifB/PqqE/SkfB family radical SAM enzyme
VSILLRGGEPFLFPAIIELLEHITQKGIFVSMDTNGTMLADFAEDIVRQGTSRRYRWMDRAIRDQLRGVPGTFDWLRKDPACPGAGEARAKPSACLTTICPPTVPLGAMPEVARSLGVKVMAIVPYYYFPSGGRRYTRELQGWIARLFLAGVTTRRREF